MADPTVYTASDCAPGVVQSGANAWAFNYKQLVENVQADIDADRKKTSRISDAWDTMRLFQHQSLVFKAHLADVNAITSGQVGQGNVLQTDSPIRTGTGDTVAASAYPANRAVDVSSAATSVAAAAVSTANSAIAAAIGEFAQLVLQGVAALQAVVVTAAGGASTPSQTSTKSGG